MKESSHTVYFQDSCLEVHVYGNPLPICASGSSLNYHCVSKSAHKSFPLFQYHQLLIHKTYNGEFTANASFSFLKHSCHTTYLLNIQNKTVVFCIRDFSQGKKKSIDITHILAKVLKETQHWGLLECKYISCDFGKCLSCWIAWGRERVIIAEKPLESSLVKQDAWAN